MAERGVDRRVVVGQDGRGAVLHPDAREFRIAQQAGPDARVFAPGKPLEQGKRLQRGILVRAEGHDAKLRRAVRDPGFSRRAPSRRFPRTAPRSARAALLPECVLTASAGESGISNRLPSDWRTRSPRRSRNAASARGCFGPAGSDLRMISPDLASRRCQTGDGSSLDANAGWASSRPSAENTITADGLKISGSGPMSRMGFSVRALQSWVTPARSTTMDVSVRIDC